MVFLEREFTFFIRININSDVAILDQLNRKHTIGCSKQQKISFQLKLPVSVSLFFLSLIKIFKHNKYNAISNCRQHLF